MMIATAAAVAFIVYSCKGKLQMTGSVDLEETPVQTVDDMFVIQTENGRFSEETLRHTIAGRIGSAMEPVTRYAGFGWEANISLLGGLAAKEVIVTTLGTAYSMYDENEESGSLAQFIARDKRWNMPSVVSFLLFVLLYAPCFVSLVTIRTETGSVKWALFSFVFNTCVAMLVATTAYQILSRWS